MTFNATSIDADRVISIREVCELTGLSRTTLWRKKSAREFPAAVRLSPGRIGFRLAEVRAWLHQRPAA